MCGTRLNRIMGKHYIDVHRKSQIVIKITAIEEGEKLLYGRCPILELLQKSNDSKKFKKFSLEIHKI